MTQEQLDTIVQQNLDDGCAFPYLLTHCPRSIAKLDQLLKDGQATHGPMDWVDLGTQGNIDHAIEHIRRMFDNYRLDSKTDHWLNAVCRLMMALEIRESLLESQKPGV